MKWTKSSMILLAAAVLGMVFSIWGPEAITRYKDKSVLEKIHTQDVESIGEGYRYILSGSERLYILSACLNRQTQPGNVKNTGTDGDAETEYGNLEGNYAFIRNRKGAVDSQISENDVYDTCNQEISKLKKLGILPQDTEDISEELYDAVLYSAIDVLEPGNNVSVWKLELSDQQRNVDKTNRLMDAYMDAGDGKIYEFYVRTSLSWEEIDTDDIIRSYSEYMGLEKPMPYESDNPLLESTPYYKKYTFEGMGGERTIVTVGFYEGINELFLKISK
ncbi:MAG: hypothetical protein GX234_07725 [Clostridiales bacterium]|nr:hypothetical protein [Clostridiales bacterium]